MLAAIVMAIAVMTMSIWSLTRLPRPIPGLSVPNWKTVTGPMPAEAMIGEVVRKVIVKPKATVRESTSKSKIWKAVESCILVVEPARELRLLPRVVESFPLGIEPTVAVPYVLHIVSRILRAIRSAQIRANASVATGHPARIIERLHRRRPHVLRHPSAGHRIVRVRAGSENPAGLRGLALIIHNAARRISRTRNNLSRTDGRQADRQRDRAKWGERIHGRAAFNERRDREERGPTEDIDPIPL
jgi:hypothetical protein